MFSKIMHRFFTLIITLSISFAVYSQTYQELYDRLKINFSKDGKFEVGGPFIGIELHHSLPLLQRISFYYPAANSIDLSTDYWKRDTSFISSMALMIDGKFELIENNKFNLEVTPFNIKFTNKNEERLIEISYHFMKNKPAMVMKINITNLSAKAADFKFLIHFDASLRTSHTYSIKEKAHNQINLENNSIVIAYDDSETKKVRLFSCNAGEKPITCSAFGNLNLLNSQKTELLKQELLSIQRLSTIRSERPAFTYIYKKDLKSREKLSIAQIIGSCKPGEEEELISYLTHNYQKEIADYEEGILKKSVLEKIIRTDDPVIDHSVSWASGILETNVHYLDGDFVPMPCPAEYNFFFTHDVLLTNLAVVNFDTKRVEHDLEFIIKHADDELTIPHAYYWKDSNYVTEYAGADNWNHFWFIINCAAYLRHTGDVEFLEKLYPYIERSLSLVMQNKKDDDLIWAYQPDWWDIGSKFGLRAYMTILAIKSIRDYNFISSLLNKNLETLQHWEKTAEKMNSALEYKLWNDEKNYLMNFYEEGVPDPHFYTGSLLAAHFNLLNYEKKEKLIDAAAANLLDPEIGIYNVYPMDFNELQSYLELLPNEAGEPFYYANGGVWPHGNAWYALGLISTGKNHEAFEFIKRNMTVMGIMNGPNGQPAMYEYRIAKKDDTSVYGIVDKPQFLWAGGWYLYALYHLLILNENDWNLSITPYSAGSLKNQKFTLDYFGEKKLILIDEKSNEWNSIVYGDKTLPTTILPAFSNTSDTIMVLTSSLPILKYTNAVLNQIGYNKEEKILECKLLAFPGHKNKTSILSSAEPVRILIDKNEHKDFVVKKINNRYLISFEFIHSKRESEIKIEF